MVDSLASFRYRALAGLVVSLLTPACGEANHTSRAPLEGLAVYQKPLTDGNSFTCSTCHALTEPAPDGIRRPGHPIGNATRRSRWKNGKTPTFLAAVNSCVTEWMVAQAWTENEPRFRALRDFLDAQAPARSAPDVKFEIVEPPANLGGGDAERGRATFDSTCSVCHDVGGTGTIRGPRIAGSLRAPEYVATRIRTSGSSTSSTYSGLTGGVMPFWAKDRLSDDELRDLVAFVTTPVESGGSPVGGGGSDGAATGGANGGAGNPAGGATPGGTGGAPGNDGGSGATASGGLDSGGQAGNSDEGTGCGKTDPRIGWRADLGINTGEGQVSGFVSMVDDCTLELTHFNYDGNGIEVHVYGSKNQSFSPGFVIGPDLFGRGFHDATLRVQLPQGKKLDDLDWVGIWCVAVGANFGSGAFMAP